MARSATAIVMEHVEAHRTVKSSRIGDVYIKDHTGHLELFKKDVRIIKKNYGQFYWRAGTVDCRVIKLSGKKYEVVL